MNNTEDLVLREYQQSLPHEQISLDLEGLIVKILLWFLGLAKLLLTQGGIERFEKSIKFYFSLIEGKTLFFDHSFKHEAWNKSTQERVVLLLDLYHPELTKAEKILLRVFGKILK